MKSHLSRLRARLSFANVTSTLALFIALGGTSYAAITLPANSVGRSQIRSDAVGRSEVRSNAIGRSEVRSSGIGKSEIARNAVGASEVREGSIDTTELTDGKVEAVDLSAAAKAALNGVTYRAFSNADGTAKGGNAKSVTRTATGVYSIDLGTDVSKCQVSATIAGTGATPGFVTVTPGTSTNLLSVNTFDNATPTPAAADRPFNLLVAC